MQYFPYQHPRSFRPFLISVALLIPILFPGVSESAQEPSTPSAPEFAEEIDVRLVTLPVLARDRHGRPITDLQPDELEIREGRQTYRVAFLTPFFDTPEERTNLPEVRLLTQTSTGTWDIARSTVKEPRHLVILADIENDPPIDRKKTMETLGRFLEQDLDSSFRVALMLFDGDLNLLVPFTQSREAVTNALGRVYGERRARARVTPAVRIEQLLQKIEICEIDEPDDQFDEAIEDRIVQFGPVADAGCLRDSLYEYAGEVIPRASGFLHALEGVIGYAAGLEGHTSVLTIGGSVALNPSREVAEAMRAVFGPLDEINQLEQSLQGEELVRPHLERVMQSAFENDVSISFLDRTPAPSDFSASQRRVLQPGYRPMITAFQTAQQDFDEIAGATGGAFVASTRVEEGLRESLSLMEGGYYLSFYLNDDEPMTPRRLRDFRINSSRSGVNLRHRRAFEGWRKPERETPDRVRGIIQVGFPVRQEVDGTTGDFLPLRLVLDPRDLGYKETGEVAAADFTVHVSLRTPKGYLLTDSYQVLTHTYPLELWRSGDIEPPELLVWADLPNGDYFAEAIVTVPNSGNRGALRRHLAVRGASEQEDEKAESLNEDTALEDNGELTTTSEVSARTD